LRAGRKLRTMADLAILLVGLVVLALIWSERDEITTAWSAPSRWWSRDPQGAFRARAPAQPGNLIIGGILGVAAVIYGALALLT
jgi:hypothetical protein